MPMKSLPFRLFALVMLLAGAIVATGAPPPAQPRFVPASGLQISLSTSGYKFLAGDAAAAGLPVSSVPDSFVAGVVLKNASRAAIPVSFSDAAAAQVRFHFTVMNSAQEVLWISDADTAGAAANMIVEDLLPRGARWNRILRVPLKLDGTWLEPGIYTLAVSLAGTPAISATAAFEVAATPTGETGITGRAFTTAPKLPFFTEEGPPIPARYTHITVDEVRSPRVRYTSPPFHWEGTSGEGDFKVLTPPGRFKVTSSHPVAWFHIAVVTIFPWPTEVPGSTSVSTEVVVRNHTLTECTLIGRPSPSGVTGTVVGTAIATGLEAAAGYANVEISQVGGLFGGTVKIVAQPDGQFRWPLSPGRYQIRAGKPRGLAVGLNTPTEEFGPVVEVVVPAVGYTPVKVSVGAFTPLPPGFSNVGGLNVISR